MRTTIRVDDRLLKEARKLAAETGRTVTAVMEDALREMLARRASGKPHSKTKFTTFAGRGLCPDVHLDNSAALLDLMEER